MESYGVRNHVLLLRGCRKAVIVGDDLQLGDLNLKVGLAIYRLFDLLSSIEMR